MESKAAKSGGGSPAAGSHADVAAQLLALGATAEDLGFSAAPEPQCLGRADTECSDESHKHPHAGESAHAPDDHGSGGGHHHPETDGRPGGEHGGGGHEHMQVFPVFELDDEGQVVETVDPQGKVTESGRKLHGQPATEKPRDQEDEST